MNRHHHLYDTHVSIEGAAPKDPNSPLKGGACASRRWSGLPRWTHMCAVASAFDGVSERRPRT